MNYVIMCFAFLNVFNLMNQCLRLHLVGTVKGCYYFCILSLTATAVNLLLPITLFCYEFHWLPWNIQGRETLCKIVELFSLAKNISLEHHHMIMSPIQVMSKGKIPFLTLWKLHPPPLSLSLSLIFPSHVVSP